MSDSDREIFSPHEIFYIHSMLFNTKSALKSIATLEYEFRNIPEECKLKDIESLNTDSILNNFQNLVIQAGSISRYFWPIRKSHNWRGLKLRKIFGINEDSPLKSRGLRNAIEHFDERLDKYLEGDIVGIIFPHFVGPRPSQDGVPGHFFRAYYLDEGVFQILGESYEISSITSALLDVHGQLKAFDENGCRFPNIDG